MYKIEKDEEEYDDDCNVIPQGPQLNASDLQNMGMPSLSTKGAQNGFTAPPPPSLPPEVKGKPEHYNPVIRIQNVSLSSLPNHLLPDTIHTSTRGTVDPVPDSGGYLDPETGQWVVESSSRRSSRSSSPRRQETDRSRHSNTQESQKVPKLTINLGPKKPTEHAFFADLDKNARERDSRRKKHHKPHKEKHKKKKKKRHYQSDSESDSDSDMS